MKTNLHRHDSLLTRLGDRTGRNLWRLWVEDNGFERLRRNNFVPGSAFHVRKRPGTGLVIEQTLIASCHVSSRRGSAVLSYEARDLAELFAGPDVRVRIHVGQIIVQPALRCHGVARPADEHWSIAGDTLTMPRASISLRSAAPLALPQTAATITVELDEQNLVFATELIGNQRPGRVKITGVKILLVVAGQFLRACGYGETDAAGEFVR